MLNMDHDRKLDDYWSSEEARIKYWDKRAHGIKEFKGDFFYTVTDIRFYVYRMERLLKEMENIDFCGKRVLEIGCGDGYYNLQAEYVVRK